MLIRMRFFCTITCGVTFVMMSCVQIFLYMKYISSIFAIDCRRWDCSSFCHSGLSISNISACGALFFPSTIFWATIGLGPGGIWPCSLLYQLWKKIAFANILKSNTCSMVNKVNFRLICVEVLRLENENFFRMVSFISYKTIVYYLSTLNKH